MIKQRRVLWLTIISSFILVTLMLAACNADIPAETTPTETASEEFAPETIADSAGAETDVVSDINEVFDTSSESSSGSNDTSDAIPADSEVDANGVPIGFTENGNPYRGNPNAPIVIEEFSDFQ